MASCASFWIRADDDDEDDEDDEDEDDELEEFEESEEENKEALVCVPPAVAYRGSSTAHPTTARGLNNSIPKLSIRCTISASRPADRTSSASEIEKTGTSHDAARAAAPRWLRGGGRTRTPRRCLRAS